MSLFLLFSIISHNILVSLPYFDRVQRGRAGYGGLYALPAEYGHVLGGADQPALGEVVHLLVNVLVVQRVHDLGLHDPLQVGDVHHHPRPGIRLPDNCHLLQEIVNTYLKKS